jgi:hypothetical protein
VSARGRIFDVLRRRAAAVAAEQAAAWDRWQAAREDTAALRRATALTRRWASLRDAMMRDLAQRI